MDTFVRLIFPSTSAEHMYTSSLINSIDLSGSINMYAGVPSIFINLFLSGAEFTVLIAHEVVTIKVSTRLARYFIRIQSLNNFYLMLNLFSLSHL